MTNKIVPVDVIGKTKSVIKSLVKQGDFDKGFQFVNELYEQGEKIAGAVGVALDIMEDSWHKFHHEGDESFMDAAVRKTVLNPVTIRNRINVRELLESDDVPEVYFESVASLGQKNLIRIANTVKGGYEIEDSEWEGLATSVHEQQVSAICRKIENKSPRSNFIGLYYKKNGEILAFVENELITIGQMNMDKNLKLEKARNVLIARAKMLDKVDY